MRNETTKMVSLGPNYWGRQRTKKDNSEWEWVVRVTVSGAGESVSREEVGETRNVRQ